MRFAKISFLSLVLVAIGFVGNAEAQTTKTADMAVSATGVGNCDISVGEMAFGNYSGSLLPGQATLTIKCTETLDYDWYAEDVPGGGRVMTNGGDTLLYVLSTTADYLTALPTSAATAAGTGTGANQTITIYGKIDGGLSYKMISYTDTVTFSVVY